MSSNRTRPSTLPRSQIAEPGVAPPPAPRRWKQAVTIWLGFFPVSLVAAYLLMPYLEGLNPALRTLISTLVLTPIMTYLVLPRVTRLLQPWLRR